MRSFSFLDSINNPRLEGLEGDSVLIVEMGEGLDGGVESGASIDNGRKRVGYEETFLLT